MTRAIIATTSVQKRKSDSQVMYIGIPSSPEEGKKDFNFPEIEEATAPLWYSYGHKATTIIAQYLLNVKQITILAQRD
jgi:hypothetical protein